MTEKEMMDMINANHDNVTRGMSFEEVVAPSKEGFDANITVDLDATYKANVARYLNDGNYNGQQVIAPKYAVYQAQKSVRSERRLAEEARRDLMKKVIAIVTAIGIGAAGVGYTVSQNWDKIKELLPSSFNVEQQYEDSTYSDYVDYVKETNGTFSEEGYRNYVENQNDGESRGASR